MGGFMAKGTFKIIRTVLTDQDKLKKIAELLGAKDPADLQQARIDLVYEHDIGEGDKSNKGGSKGKKR